MSQCFTTSKNNVIDTSDIQKTIFYLLEDAKSNIKSFDGVFEQFIHT